MLTPRHGPGSNASSSPTHSTAWCVPPHLRAPVRVPSPDACAVVQILEECGVEPTTAIERLLRQLVATNHAIRDANDGFGQNFHLADAESHG